MMGRPPKPTKLKILTGNPGKRKLNKAEPVAPAGNVHQPEWLSPEAKAEWSRLLPLLQESGLATSLDSGILGQYCESLCIYEKATLDIQKNGMTYVAESGLTKVNPAIRIQLDSAKILSSLSDKLGMNPSARSRLSVSTEKPKTRLQEFLERNRGGNKAS